MKAKDYIIKKLESFIEIFSNSKVRYEHDERSSSHTIEIQPREVYEKNEKYITWESEFFDKFISEYPSENICFISDNALVKIDNVVFEKEGLYYAPFSVKNKSLFEMSSIHIHRKSVKEDLSFTCSKSNPTLITMEKTNIPVEYTNYSYLTAA